MYRAGNLFCYLCFLAIFFCCGSCYGQIKNENDLKKQANQWFEEENYNSAYKSYAQLVSLYPKDPEYNYRLGVCMLYTEPDKKKPFSYLLLATKNPKDAPKDAKFYLAKAYHINYQFDEALKLYTEYKTIGSASSIKKLQVDREIEACKNGKRLLSNLSDLVVMTKKQLNEADYFRSYDVSGVGGKLLTKPDEFKTPYDKKKKDQSVVYLPKSGETLYFSSYGENGETGRDIYVVNKLPGGTWNKPQALPTIINTGYDEDYPFLHPNGKTLYFSSKGHNSMGGYDIFKTTFDDRTRTWSKPINLEFPINSPDDDILFVTDSLEKTAFFSTGRYSPYGKIDVLKINTERRLMNFAFLKGTVVKENATQSVKSKITVKNMDNGELVGSYQAQENGDYAMELPNGGKFMFTVETPGLDTQSEAIQIPVAYSLKPYKQVISYDNQKLKIINYFDGQVDDQNYAMMIDLIEKKAKLEVSEADDHSPNLKDTNTLGQPNNKLSSIATTNPTVMSDDNANITNKNVTNEQLLNMAKEDAKEAGEEALKLRREAQEAFGLATQQTSEALTKQKAADEAFAKANAMSDVVKKNEELTSANNLQEEAKRTTDIANLATNLAKKLEVDANAKQKEADLTTQYIRQLESIIKNKNNKEALAKLEQIQQELDAISQQKNQSDELLTSIKAELELKQQELDHSEKKSLSIQTEMDNIKKEAKTLENELNTESDKDLKSNMAAQIRELNADVDLKNKELTDAREKITVLKQEVEKLDKELDFAAKILNEKSNGTVSKNTDEVSVNTTTNAISQYDAPNPLKDGDERGKKTITSTTATSTTSGNNNGTAPESNTATKKTPASGKDTTATAKNTPYLDGLKALKNEWNAMTELTSGNFSYSYKEASSNALKQNAQQKLETAQQNQFALKALILETETNLTSIASGSVTADQLVNEAEALSNKAYEQRKEAVGKTGTEKEELLKEASENETLAMNKKLEASTLIQEDNKSKYTANNTHLIALQRLTGSKTSEAISKADLLIDEAILNYKQAEKLRNEAANYPNASAKLGGLNNAEEKENEALLKQQKALAILLPLHPNYQIKPTDGTNKPSDALARIRGEIEKYAQTQAEAYLALSKTNQNELKLQGANLLKKPAFKNNTNKLAQAFKSKSDSLNTEANANIAKALVAATPKEKANLLLKANDKEIEALKMLDKATESFIDGITSISVIPADKPSNKNTNQTMSDGKNTTMTNSLTPSTEGDVVSSVPTTSVISNKPKEGANVAVVTNSLANAANTNQNAATSKNTNSTVPTNSNQNTTTTVTAKKPVTSNNNVQKPVNPNTTPITNSSTATNTTTPVIAKKTDSVTSPVVSTTNTITPVARNLSSPPARTEAIALQTNLNDSNEAGLVSFNTYQNNEAGTLKNEAVEQLNKALQEDKRLNTQLDSLTNLTPNDTLANTPTQNEITTLASEAEQLANQAYELRKFSSTKAPAEKQKDINAAAKLEAEATRKKMEAANKQQQFNSATYLTNKKNLEELALMAQNQNIQELNSTNLQLNEANLFFKQAEKLRKEANTSSTDAAKLGGYGNAEEKENQAIAKQQVLLERYKNYFPNYAPKTPAQSTRNPELTAALEQAKANLNNNQLKHINALSVLAQANDKEYQSRMASLPTGLNTNQQSIKTKAQNAYTTSQEILKQANQTNDLNQKKKALVDANKNAQTAIELLNQVAMNTIANTTNPVNTNSINAIPRNKENGLEKGIEFKTADAYTASNPIPMNEKLPDGLIFKVQIGAFRTTLPNNTFKGLSPVIAQTTPNGYIRYMAGNFDLYAVANTVKDNLKNLGYRDAFVVAYFNGQRITLNEAVLKAQNSGQSIESTTNQINAMAITGASQPTTSNINLNNTLGDSPPVIAKELENTNGLLYTIQIGIYANQVKQSQLYNLRPIYTEKLPNGSYRYTAGIYNQPNKLLEDKRKVVSMGINDAFVSAYYNTKRIPFTEGKKLQTENSSIKMEQENPIIFPENIPAAISTPIAINPTNQTIATNTIVTFSNGVTKGPEPTPQNGVKTDEAGISFKVQIGAYKNQIPNDVASKFLSIKTWPVNNTPINGLYIYTIGNFNAISYAKKLKDEAVAVGITDAFVTVYKDGKKLYGAEAAQYLSR